VYKGRKGVLGYTFLMRTNGFVRGVQLIRCRHHDSFESTSTSTASSFGKMAIIVREVSDDDLPRAVEIEAAAYADNPLAPLFFPGPFPPESRQQSISHLIDTRKNNPSVKYLQAYDEETGQMVAFAKWSIYETHEAAAASQRPIRTFGPGTNPEACQAFFGTLASKKKELMGDKPHLCKSRPHLHYELHALICDRSPIAAH
jgi:hypothetical protein